MSGVVIIGASHAAAEVISTLRRKDYDGNITLVGDEECPPYQRPPLSKKYFCDEMPAEKLQITNAATYEKANVTQKLGHRAVRIDRSEKTVTLDNAEVLAYEKLILAMGTRARRLPVAGAESPAIHYLRTKRDVDEIKASLQGKSRLLIVGGGYIGLEVAASAIQLGKQVVVLEAMQRVLQRVTSSVVSEFYQNLHQSHGVDIRLGAMLEKFNATGSGMQAELADGDSIDFDAAIIGIGVIPNTELAEQAGLDCDNGIIVDEFTKTSDPDIYAIGDCSNHPSFIYDRRLRLESVPNAMAQAKTAALSICGEDITYNEVPWFWSDQYDVKLQTVGLCQGYDQLLIRGEPKESKFAVFYLKDQQLLACDAINSPAEFMVSRKLIASKAQPDPKLLVDASQPIKNLLK